MIYEKEKRYIIPFGDVPTDRAEMPEITVDERRGNFTEVETGFPEETAVKEAKRCLSCRRCLGCALCWAECKPEAIDFGIPDQELALDFDDVVVAGGQDNLFHPVRADLGYGKYPDVIVDLQLERMLSPTGPTKGMVLSPLDGRIPATVALVQGNPEDDESQILSGLVFGVNAAVIALHNTRGLEVTLVSPVCSLFKEQFLSSAKNIPGLTIIPGLPISVEKGDSAQPLHLTYSNSGEESRQAFDLIVVLTKPKISPEMASLNKNLKET
jgi:heterodisulfide reductase subunit A-like polyferredoxin